MDTQLKRGFLEACVLATLCEGPSYGYRILRSLPKELGIAESTLYPILRRLEHAGCLSVEAREHNGRLRKYYAITAQGRARLRDFIDDESQVRSIYRFVRAKAGPEKEGLL